MATFPGFPWFSRFVWTLIINNNDHIFSLFAKFLWVFKLYLFKVLETILKSLKKIFQLFTKQFTLIFKMNFYRLSSNYLLFSWTINTKVRKPDQLTQKDMENISKNWRNFLWSGDWFLTSFQFQEGRFILRTVNMHKGDIFIYFAPPSKT